MKELKKQIKDKNIKNIYLFYGEEEYLKKFYLEKIKKIIIGDSDDMMNFNIFEGKDISADKIMESAETIPFLAPNRLIIIENSQFFKSGKKNEIEKLADYITDIPQYTYIIFIEKEVDKRSKLYKQVKKNGEIVEFNHLKENDMIKWIKISLKKQNKIINNNDAMYLIRNMYNDMQRVENELQKLISYKYYDEEITKKDIDKICSKSTDIKVFEMLDEMSLKNGSEALKKYNDLINSKEPPNRILFMIIRQFRLILQVKLLSKEGLNPNIIAQKLKIPFFVVKGCISQAKYFTEDILKLALKECLQADKDIKSGKIDPILCVELIVIRYSKKKLTS